MANKKVPKSTKKKNIKVKIRIDINSIIKDPNPILRKVSDETPLPLSKSDKDTMSQMIDYVASSQNPEEIKKRNLRASVGISAIQLGIPKKMLYVRPIDSHRVLMDEFALVNPKYISKSEKKSYLHGGESCLSVEDETIYKGNVIRHHNIKIEGLDFFTDRIIEIEAKGFTSIVLQHEMDHLNGIMFYDRINKLAPKHIPKGAIKI